MCVHKQCEDNQNTAVSMSHTTSGLYPSFKLNQLNTLSLWGVVRPVGLSVRIATDHDFFPEVAMLYQRDCYDMRYLIYPKDQGRVILVQLRGEKWEMPTLETALGKVVLLEQRSAAA